MNILVIAEWYPYEDNLEFGVFVKRQVEAVCNRYAEVNIIVVFARTDHTLSDVELDVINRDGYQEYYVRYPEKKTLLGRFFCYRSSMLMAIQKVREVWQQVDITWCQVAWRSALVGYTLLHKKNIPYVISEHWTGYDERDGRFLKSSFMVRKWITKLMYKASCVVTVSQSQLDAMRTHFELKHAQVIGNVVLPNDCHAAKFDSTTLLHISTLSYQKNIPLLLDAFDMYLEVDPQARLLIVGGDAEHQLITRDLIYARDLDPYVEVLGYRSPSDMNDLLCKSHMLLHTSRFESFSMVIAESWAAGLPTIATACGGLTDDIPRFAGASVRVHSATAVYEALVSARQNYSNFDPAKIKNLAIEFHPDQIADNYYQLFIDIADQS